MGTFSRSAAVSRVFGSLFAGWSCGCCDSCAGTSPEGPPHAKLPATEAWDWAVVLEAARSRHSDRLTAKQLGFVNSVMEVQSRADKAALGAKPSRRCCVRCCSVCSLMRSGAFAWLIDELMSRQESITLLYQIQVVVLAQAKEAVATLAPDTACVGGSSSGRGSGGEACSPVTRVKFSAAMLAHMNAKCTVGYEQAQAMSFAHASLFTDSDVAASSE